MPYTQPHSVPEEGFGTIFDQPWWKRLTSLEPALVRSVVIAVVGVLALAGLDATAVGDKLIDGWTYIFAVLPLIQGWWTRQAVVPTAKTVAVLRPDGQVEAADAAPEPNGEIVTVQEVPEYDAERLGIDPHPYLDEE